MGTVNVAVSLVGVISLCMWLKLSVISDIMLLHTCLTFILDSAQQDLNCDTLCNVLKVCLYTAITGQKHFRYVVILVFCLLCSRQVIIRRWWWWD